MKIKSTGKEIFHMFNLNDDGTLGEKIGSHVIDHDAENEHRIRRELNEILFKNKIGMNDDKEKK